MWPQAEIQPGGMAEWFNAAVLKTVDCNRSGGSNPSSSATINEPLTHMSYYVYILNSEGYNKYYIGSTQDISERLLRHNSGKERFTKKFIPWNLVLQMEKETRSEAYQLELKLKNLNREKLLKFIEKYKL